MVWSNPDGSEDPQRSPILLMVSKLGLSEFYPKKLTVQHVQMHSHRHTDTIEDLPWVILRQLLMGDNRSRDRPVDCMNQQNPSFANEMMKFEDILLGNCISSDNSDVLHPMDVLYVTLSCCDLLLTQKLYQRLVMCRLAFPLFTLGISNKLDFMLWSMRTSILDCDEGREVNAVMAQIKIISFIRIGDLNQSKSALLNSIVESKCQTFFNTECLGGRNQRSCTNGNVEATWKLPDYQHRPHMKEPILYVNLRGDASDYPRQRDMICDMSNVVICLTSFGNLAISKKFDTLRESLLQSRSFIIVPVMNNESHDVMRAHIPQNKGPLE